MDFILLGLVFLAVLIWRRATKARIKRKPSGSEESSTVLPPLEGGKIEKSEPNSEDPFRAKFEAVKKKMEEI